MKVALITGASSGFGLNTALALAEQGRRVFAAARQVERAEALKLAAGQGELAGSITLEPMDVTSEQSVGAAVERILATTKGRIDALVNKAGFSIMGAFEDLSDARAQPVPDLAGGCLARHSEPGPVV